MIGSSEFTYATSLRACGGTCSLCRAWTHSIRTAGFSASIYIYIYIYAAFSLVIHIYLELKAPIRHILQEIIAMIDCTLVMLHASILIISTNTVRQQLNLQSGRKTLPATIPSSYLAAPILHLQQSCLRDLRRDNVTTSGLCQYCINTTIAGPIFKHHDLLS